MFGLLRRRGGEILCASFLETVACHGGQFSELRIIEIIVGNMKVDERTSSVEPEVASGYLSCVYEPKQSQAKLESEQTRKTNIRIC